MRTTVNLDPDLLTQAKVLAARRRTSIGAVIDDALRSMLNRAPVSAASPSVVLETDGGSGLQPGVDLEDRGLIAHLLGDDDPPRAAG